MIFLQDLNNNFFEEKAFFFLKEIFLSDVMSRLFIEQRPYANKPILLAKADQIWRNLGTKEQFLSIMNHPRIGDLQAVQNTKFSQNEQEATSSASDTSIREFAKLNSLYEQRFGFLYLVFASDKNTEELLHILKCRLSNTLEDERLIALWEKNNINLFRLNTNIKDVFEC